MDDWRTQIAASGGSVDMYERALSAVGEDWTDTRDIGDADLIHYLGHLSDRGVIEESQEIIYRDNGHPCGCIVRFRKNDPK